MSSAKIEDESGEAELPWFEGNFAQALDHAEKHFQFIFAVLETDVNPFKRELLATSQLLDLLGKGKLILWGSVANTAEVRKVATDFGCMELPIAILITPVSLPGVNSNVLATFPENSIAQVFTETLLGSINVNTPRINRIRDDRAAQAATQDDEEFRIISTLCHVLDNPSLFNHTSESRRLFQIPLKVNINAQPYMGKSTRAHLKTLRQLCFLLVRNHEIIAAVPHVLPGGVVGVLSGTTTSGEILGDKSALLHLTHNDNDVSGSNRFCMQTIPSTQPPEKIMKHILSSWGSDFETHCATVASLIKALVNNREELGTCAADLIIYVHAVSSPKLRRRFKRTSHDSRDPHHLNVLEHAGTTDNMLTVDYNYAVTTDQIHILDTADGFRCLLSLSPTERAWFRGQQPWSGKETEYPPPLINSYNWICDFLVKLESGELQPAKDNVGSFYYHFLQYAIALFSLYGDYISRIEKVTLLPDAPIGECLANFQRDVVCATKIADKVTELAWDSPMLKRVLSVLNLEMWKSKEQLKAIMDRKRKSSVVAGPSPLLGLDTTEDEQMQEPAAEEQTVTEDEEDELSNKDLEEDEDEYVETLGKKLITLKPVNMNEFEMAQKILLWMRLVTFQIKSIFQWEYTATSRRVKSPLLSLALIKPPIATHNTLNWCEYVKQLVPPEDSVDAAEALQHYATKSGIAKLQRVDSCHRHCEAMLASLVYVAKNNMKSYRSDLKSILPVLRGVPEIFGTSKRCCHICNTVIGFLCEDSAKFTMLDSHSSIYPYSLPPLLPPLIRKSIIDYYKKPLVDALVSLIAAYRQQKKLDERPRMRSLDSNPGFSSSDGSESEGEGIGQKKVRMPRRTLASILNSEKYLE